MSEFLIKFRKTDGDFYATGNCGHYHTQDSRRDAKFFIFSRYVYLFSTLKQTPTKIIIHVLQFVYQTKGSVPLTNSGTMHLLVSVEIENEHFYTTLFLPIGIGVGTSQCDGILICSQLSRMIFHHLICYQR